jgi:signal transduction histidine kinase
MILEGDLGDLSKTTKDAVERIYESSSTLASVVDDYLNISRIELGTMKYVFDKLDLKDLVVEVIAEIQPNIDRSGTSFSLTSSTGPFIVKADKDKIKQVIANLIDNAIKYTPKGKVVASLSAVSGDSGKPVVRFETNDNGIGINKEVLPKLFSKFTRAENGNRTNIHGTGLGLYVAKEIVGAHKGKIWAESEGEGKGSKFVVELPVS